MTGAERIAKERQRQIYEEGWTAEHDDSHRDQDMAWAATCFAAPAPVYLLSVEAGDDIRLLDPWPCWDEKWDHRPRDEYGVIPYDTDKKCRIELLVKAGALIAAEIDRLQRLQDKDK